MSGRDRAKRPELDRSQPIRNWSTLFGPSNSAKAQPADGKEAVGDAVQTGYRVIDEYVRQGQEFAQKIWSPLGSSSPLGGDPQRLTERIYQSASDLASSWLQLVQTTMPGGSSVSPSFRDPTARSETQVNGFDIGPGQSATTNEKPDASVDLGAASPSISVEISSKKRSELFVDLKPGAGQCKLRAHDLRAADPAQPRIGGIIIEAHPSDNRVAVRLEIPADQPAGIYSGLVVDGTTNLPRGTLSIRVFD